MRALSLWQPWAQLIAIGAKRIETRSWSTSYRGALAIHAAKAMPREARMFAYRDPAGKVLNDAGILLGGDCAALPRGAIVATAVLKAVLPTDDIQNIAKSVGGLLPHEIDFGDYSHGRFGWVLSDVQALRESIPCKGALGLWAVPADVECAIRKQSVKVPA